jgi:hypothetical protein
LDEVVDRLDGCPQGKYFAAVLLIWRHLQRRELEPAGALIDSLIAEIPEVPLPRLLRCQWLTLQGAPLPYRLQACRDLLRVQPNSKEGLAALPILENEQRMIATAATADWSTSVVIGAGLSTDVRAA